MEPNSPAQPFQISEVGKKVDTIRVTIGPQFLNLFSEHLYSSPNKAFEELVSNSWDAGATVAYIRVPEQLDKPLAAVWVLDNGASMDIHGLQQLWHVGTSTKRQAPVSGRPQIGKFGIGKLATYILSNELTYICRASDSVTRAVTMDFTRIDHAAAATELHIDPMPLDVRELDDTTLEEMLRPLGIADEILPLIRSGVKPPGNGLDWQDEFAHPEKTPSLPTGTWTLVVMTSLKQSGQKMQIGWIRRMLRAALPLSPSISIILNDEPLTPLRSEVPVAIQWSIGPGLGIPTIEVPKSETEVELVVVKEVATPYPHIEIEGLPEAVTGNVYLFEDRISGGKSEGMGASNGFFVNVLGRVINAEDADFGLSNLSHSAWAKFRACVRADGLDEALAITREDIKKTREVRIFKALLLALFNKARNEDTRLTRAGWPNAGQILSESWFAVPFEPLRKIIGERLTSVIGLPPFVKIDPTADKAIIQQEWKEITQDRSGTIIQDVSFESLGVDEPLAQYDLAQRRIIVNKNHPFTLEHSESHEEQQFVRNIALVELLTDSYMLDVGVDDQHYSQIREYRDQILRLIAQVNRRSATMIAQMLMQARSSPQGLEKIVGDALRHLGFIVEVLGQSGEPEGVATAPLPRDPARLNETASYSFTYDAKSTGHAKVTTQNLNSAGLARHRANKQADHTLVVAPEYTVAPALISECRANKLTPMRTEDLGSLVLLIAAVGSLDLSEFRKVFDLFHPDDVHAWVEQFKADIERNKPGLTLPLFLQAVESIGYSAPNAINAAVIAHEVGVLTNKAVQPKLNDVIAVVNGLSVMVPQLVRKTSMNDIHFSTSPKGLRDALAKQIQRIPQDYRVGYMRTFSMSAPHE